MYKNFWDTLSRSKTIRFLLDTPAPKWAILAVDLLLVAISVALTFRFSQFLAVNPTANPMWFNSGVRGAFIVLAYLVASLSSQSYKYILRLSVIADIYRMALMVLEANILLIAASATVEVVTGFAYFRYWNLLTIAIFSFSMMACMRLVLKYIYSLCLRQINVRERVIMLGSAINSFFLATTLKDEVGGQLDPVAMIALNSKAARSSYQGIPILPYDEKQIPKIFEQYRCNTLLILSNQIEFIRSGAADVFLNNNIKLLMLNQVEEFDVTSDRPSLSSQVKRINIEDLLGRDPIDTHNPNTSRLIRNQVVMVTGAAGSIGSEIVRQVATFGAREIVLIDQAETPMHDMQLEMEESFPNTRIHLFIGDITNRDRMERAFVKYKPRHVFHAAAYKHVPMMERNPVEAIRNNVFGTKNVADLSIIYGVEKFVMISTDKAVNPTNIMGASKRIAEIYVQSLHFHNHQMNDRPTTRFITTRFGNVLGSNGSVIPRFKAQIDAGGPVTVTHRDIIRYFMTIPEACSLVLEAGCMGNGGEIYVFDMGQPVKIYDLACRMISLAGYRPNQDIKIVETGLRPGEKLYEELLNDKELTTATHHPKIMIAKVRIYDYKNVVEHLKTLHRALAQGDTHSLVAEMKHIVPEFHSRNSKWEQVDHEIEEEVTTNNLVEIQPNTPPIRLF